MLKKIFSILIIFFGLNSYSYSYDTMSMQLTKIENTVLGIDYNNEKTEKRLSRLEKNIYGKEKTGSIQSRLNKLNKDIAADVIGQEIKPSTDTFLSEEDYVISDNSEKYPIIDEIEQKLFMQNSPEKSLNKRIQAIERNMFNKTYDTEDYFDRMERIKAEFYSKNPPIAYNNTDNYMSYYNEPDLQSFYTNPQTRNYNNYGKTTEPYSVYNIQDQNELLALEQKILKNTYPNESINDRLSRLEVKMFDTDFFYDDDKIRMDRISAAAKVKKHRRFTDSPKFQTGINTAMSAASMILMILALIF